MHEKHEGTESLIGQLRKMSAEEQEKQIQATLQKIESDARTMAKLGKTSTVINITDWEQHIINRVRRYLEENHFTCFIVDQTNNSWMPNRDRKWMRINW